MLSTSYLGDVLFLEWIIIAKTKIVSEKKCRDKKIPKQPTNHHHHQNNPSTIFLSNWVSWSRVITWWLLSLLGFPLTPTNSQISVIFRCNKRWALTCKIDHFWTNIQEDFYGMSDFSKSVASAGYKSQITAKKSSNLLFYVSAWLDAFCI